MNETMNEENQIDTAKENETEQENQHETSAETSAETSVETSLDLSEKSSEKSALAQQKRKSEKEESCKQQLLRVSADFENFKRRIEKERMFLTDLGKIGAIKAFLPIIDTFDRAMATPPDSHDVSEQWLKGIDLIHKECHKVLKELSVEQIDCSNGFNPELHEALVQIDAPNTESGAIIEVLKPGYRYHDRVLRHAQVSVAR